MKKKIIPLLLITFSTLSLFGCDSGSSTKPSESGLKPGVVSFSYYCSNELFAKVPAMEVAGTGISAVRDVGDSHYLIDVNGTTLKDYESYLNLLKDNDFSVTASNGSEGLYNSVYNTSLKKDSILVTVVQLTKIGKTSIIVTEKVDEISPHLAPSNEHIPSDKKTTLTMLACDPKMNGGSNSFVVMLKNGHFLISDGGRELDANALINYLYELTGGEKPVIEGWFISHSHGDHAGALTKISGDLSIAKKLIVDGIYYSAPPMDVVNSLNTDACTAMTPLAGNTLTSSDGGKAPLYRTYIGQKYYFCDVECDIMFSQDWLPLSGYGGDFNDSTTYVMMIIEGQKVLFSGDGGRADQQRMITYFDAEDFDLTIMTSSHHGFNNTKEFTDFVTVDTVLNPHFALVDPIYPDSLEYLLRYHCKEWYSYYDGSVKITFPYTLGSAEILPSHYIYKDHEAFRKVDEWK